MHLLRRVFGVFKTGYKLIKITNMGDQNLQNALSVSPVYIARTAQLHFKHIVIHYFEYEIKTNY